MLLTIKKGVIRLTIVQKIRLMLTYLGISESELARRMKTSPSALNQRLATGKFKDEDFQKMAEAMGVKIEFKITAPDGTTF